MSVAHVPLRWLAMIAIAGLLVGTKSSASAAPVSIDFNGGPTDFTNNFTVFNTADPNSNFAWGAGLGIADQPGGAHGGGLQATGSPTEETARYTASTFNLSDGQMKTASAYVSAPTLQQNDRIMEIGFLAPGSLGFNTVLFGTTPTGYSFIAARMLANNYSVELQFSNGAFNATSLFQTTPTGTIAPEDWVQLIFNAQQTAPGNFQGTFSLIDYGPTGTGAGTVVLQPVAWSVAGLSNMGDGSALSTGFRTAYTSATPVLFDNFSVTPEPTGIALILISGAALAARRSRCNNG